MTRERTYAEKSSQGFNALLLKTVGLLNDDGKSEEPVSEALSAIRSFFAFGSAFVYECDHTKTFFLKESSPVYDHDSLPNTFRLEDCIDAPTISQISSKKTYQTDCDCCADHQEFLHNLCQFFSVQSLIIIFITDDDGGVIGCVGMADMRYHAALEGEELHWANTLLRLIAQRAHLRIYKQRLQYAGDTLENIMDHTGFDIYVNDYETHEMLYANQSMAAPYGGWENMRGKTCHAALYEGQDHECEFCPKQKIIDDEGNPSKIYSWDYQRPFDKTWFRVISAAFRWTDGRLAQVISSSDITEAKNNELLVYQMAHYDTLTGLANRRKLEQDLESFLSDSASNSRANNAEIAVLFLDLDNFKQVNDTLGHSGGDALLKHLAAILEESPLTANHCYRYGGDEFVFLYENTSREEANEISKRILEIIKKPFCFEDFTHSCEGSIGISIFPEDGDDYWQLLDKADDTMYHVKSSKKGRTRTTAQLE